MELRLHLKAFNQKVWASMFKQCLRTLVKAKPETLAGMKALIQKLFMQSPGYREMAASPHFWPPGLLVIHCIFPQQYPAFWSILQWPCNKRAHLHEPAAQLLSLFLLGTQKNLISAPPSNPCKIQQKISSLCRKGYAHCGCLHKHTYFYLDSLNIQALMVILEMTLFCPDRCLCLSVNRLIRMPSSCTRSANDLYFKSSPFIVNKETKQASRGMH